MNIAVITTLKYCYKKALNKKLKLMGGAIKYLMKKLLGYKILWSVVSWATKCFWKIYKILKRWRISRATESTWNIFRHLLSFRAPYSLLLWVMLPHVPATTIPNLVLINWVHLSSGKMSQKEIHVVDFFQGQLTP